MASKHSRAGFYENSYSSQHNSRGNKTPAHISSYEHDEIGNKTPAHPSADAEGSEIPYGREMDGSKTPHRREFKRDYYWKYRRDDQRTHAGDYYHHHHHHQKDYYGYNYDGYQEDEYERGPSYSRKHGRREMYLEEPKVSRPHESDQHFSSNNSSSPWVPRASYYYPVKESESEPRFGKTLYRSDKAGQRDTSPPKASYYYPVKESISEPQLGKTLQKSDKSSQRSVSANVLNKSSESEQPQKESSHSSKESSQSSKELDQGVQEAKKEPGLQLPTEVSLRPGLSTLKEGGRKTSDPRSLKRSARSASEIASKPASQNSVVDQSSQTFQDPKESVKSIQEESVKIPKAKSDSPVPYESLESTSKPDEMLKPIPKSDELPNFSNSVAPQSSKPIPTQEESLHPNSNPNPDSELKVNLDSDPSSGPNFNPTSSLIHTLDAGLNSGTDSKSSAIHNISAPPSDASTSETAMSKAPLKEKETTIQTLQALQSLVEVTSSKNKELADRFCEELRIKDEKMLELTLQLKFQEDSILRKDERISNLEQELKSCREALKKEISVGKERKKMIEEKRVQRNFEFNRYKAKEKELEELKNWIQEGCKEDGVFSFVQQPRLKDGDDKGKDALGIQRDGDRKHAKKRKSPHQDSPQDSAQDFQQGSTGVSSPASSRDLGFFGQGDQEGFKETGVEINHPDLTGEQRSEGRNGELAPNLTREGDRTESSFLNSHSSWQQNLSFNIKMEETDQEEESTPSNDKQIGKRQRLDFGGRNLAYNYLEEEQSGMRYRTENSRGEFLVCTQGEKKSGDDDEEEEEEDDDRDLA